MTESSPSEGSSRQAVRWEVNVGSPGSKSGSAGYGGGGGAQVHLHHSLGTTGHQGLSSHAAPGTRGPGCVFGGPVGGCLGQLKPPVVHAGP